MKRWREKSWDMGLENGSRTVLGEGKDRRHHVNARSGVVASYAVLIARELITLSEGLR